MNQLTFPAYADETGRSDYATALRRLIETVPRSRVWSLWELTEEAGLVEPEDVSKINGAVMSAMRRQGIVVSDGFTASKRPATAGSAVRLWRRA